MKKKNLKTLQLNKISITNLDKISGGETYVTDGPNVDIGDPDDIDTLQSFVHLPHGCYVAHTRGCYIDYDLFKLHSIKHYC